MATKKVTKKPAAKKTTKPATKKAATTKVVKRVSKPAAKPVAKKKELKDCEISIVVAMAVEAVILLLGYLVIMHYAA